MTLPDAEALLVAALKAQSTVSTPVGGRIGTRLSGTYPAVRVTLLGGASRPTDQTGQPDLQVEIWGSGSTPAAETEASDIARAAEAAVPALRGTYGAGTVVGAQVGGYLLHTPDEGSGRERYLFSVTLLMQ